MRIPTSFPDFLSRIPDLFRLPYLFFRRFITWVRSFPGFQILLLSRFLTAAPIATWGVLIMILPSLLWYVLTILGVTFVTYLGVHVAVDQLVSMAQSRLHLLPPEVFQIMGIMQLDVGFKMIVSAGLVKLVLRGWDKLSGVFKHFRINPAS